MACGENIEFKGQKSQFPPHNTITTVTCPNPNRDFVPLTAEEVSELSRTVEYDLRPFVKTMPNSDGAYTSYWEPKETHRVLRSGETDQCLDAPLVDPSIGLLDEDYDTIFYDFFLRLTELERELAGPSGNASDLYTAPRYNDGDFDGDDRPSKLLLMYVTAESGDDPVWAENAYLRHSKWRWPQRVKDGTFWLLDTPNLESYYSTYGCVTIPSWIPRTVILHLVLLLPGILLSLSDSSVLHKNRSN